ncbi:MAG: saccharopine dehydrogenase, partial [Myxococcales bacterium]|nr:saccharopine dehydrogenase [Myxococcales bacterium]
VGACARAGTHYLDLTGEVPFMRRSLRTWHDTAQRTGARIVHASGYDSIPSDLGVAFLQDQLTRSGGPAGQVVTAVVQLRGAASGGTLASMMAILDDAVHDRELRRALAKPYTLDPEGTPPGPDGRDQTAPRWDPLLRRWTAPWFMEPVNSRVVRRSHALRGRPWGEDFRYRETLATGRGVGGRVRALGITAGLGAFLGAASTPWLREHLLPRLLPAPGEGPDAAAREAGSFRHHVVGKRGDALHTAVVSGPKDPGYGSTALLLGEATLHVATQDPSLPDAAGVLTPATGLGLGLVPRLREVGLTFEL